MEEPLSTIPAPPAEDGPGSGWSSGPPSGFSVGQVLSRTFSTWWRGAVLFCALGAAASVPMAVVQYAIYSTMGMFPDPAQVAADPFGTNALVVHWRVFLGGSLVSILLWGFMFAAVIHRSAQALQGGPVRLQPALVAAVHRGPYVIGVMLLGWVAMTATICTLVFPFVLMVGWCAAMPSTVLEGTGPVQALGRSWALTRGFRWPLLAAFVVISLAGAMGAMALYGVSVGIATALAGPAALGPGPILGGIMAGYQLLAGALGTLTMVGCAAAHHALRAIKEGGDPLVLGRVFE